MAIGANVSAVLGRWREGARLTHCCHRPARPGDPVFQRRRRSNREGAAYWMAPASRGMTAENAAPLPEPSATVSLCDAFPVGFKLRNELRTNRGRIADSPLSPV